MLLQTYKTLDNAELQAAWRSMETHDVSPFCYLDYMRYVYAQVKYASAYSPRILTVKSDDGAIQMIVPTKFDHFKRAYRLLGDIQGCGHTAPLFAPNITTEQKIELTRYLLSAVPNDFWICRLYEPQLIMRMERSNNRIERTECVRIHLQQNADHLRSLKPSVRQNLRTAYNRLKRDGVEWHIETFLNSKNPMDDKMWNKLMTVYLSRLFGKYKRRNPVRQAYREFIYKHIKHDTKSLHSLPNGFHALLLEGDNVMGFLSGLISHDRSQLVVPRLAINAEYRFYSPGYILLSELIKRLTACTPCRILDLSRGNERYKLDMGGEIYHTLNLKRAELCMEIVETPKEYLQ